MRDDADRNRFESNVNYDLGKTSESPTWPQSWFESNVNYDLGKTPALCQYA